MSKTVSFFADIVSSSVVEKELVYKGKSKSVYFRTLTAAERADISRGQKIQLRRQEERDNGEQPQQRSIEVDAADIMHKTHRFLSYCCVDQKGAAVFKNANEVGALPEDLVSILNDLANEALTEQDPGDDLGKSSETSQSSD